MKTGSPARFGALVWAGVLLAAALCAAGAPPAGAQQGPFSPRFLGRGGAAPEAEQPVRIGVLADRGVAQCLAQWQPTADYLTQSLINHRFTIVPLSYDAMDAAVVAERVEFILTNPCVYVQMAVEHGVNRIATRKTAGPRGETTHSGGVVFCKGDRMDIRTANDLWGKSFAAVDPHALGGWSAAWRELADRGINPRRAFAPFIFAGTPDAVVAAVRDGRADVGTVRTGVLEQMADAGSIRLGEFRVIDLRQPGNKVLDFPFLCSTRLYPEWPLAKLPHTSDVLAQQVVVALLSMPIGSPAAAASECAGWSVPLDYLSVHELMRELHVSPYEHYGEVSLGETLRQQWLLVSMLAVLVALLVAAIVCMRRLNRRLRLSTANLHRDLEERGRAEEEQRRASRAYALLAACNETLAKGRDEVTLLDEVSRLIVEVGGYRLAWVGLAENDAAKSVRPVAHHGFEDGYIDTLKITWADDERGRGPAGTAIRTGRASVARHIETTPAFEPWRDNALQRGYASALALPILAVEGRALGVVCIYAGEPDAFSEPEVELLQKLADNLGMGMQWQRGRLQAQQGLRESEERYHHLFENLYDAAFLADSETGLILDANLAAQTLLGRTRQEILGMHQTQLHPPGEEDKYRQFFADHVRRGEAANYDGEVVRKDGTIVPVGISASHLTFGGRLLLLGIFRDISERKAAEAKLRQREEQLYQAGKLESVGRLAGGIAHDFNNILTGVIGYTQFVLEKLPPDDPTYHDLSQVKGLGERAAGLTRQLLAFSKHQPLEPAVTDLNELVGCSCEMLRRLIGEDVQLEFVPGPDVWNVRIDRGQIEQVLMNLAINARDAMPIGGRLTIETSNAVLDETCAENCAEVQPGSYVQVSVSDTGCGMDRETMSHLFEPFFTTKGPAKGTGLGLSTAYGIIKQHGGSIRFSSEPGSGTTFKIYLPRVEAPVEAASQDVLAAVPRGCETILIVEDEATVRSLAVRILTQQGYHVLTAATPAAATDVMAEHGDEVRLLLTDVIMPGESGPVLYKRLTVTRPGLPVLYMSGYTDSGIMFHGLDGGGPAFITKPFSPASLARKVRSVLDGVAAAEDDEGDGQ